MKYRFLASSSLALLLSAVSVSAAIDPIGQISRLMTMPLRNFVGVQYALVEYLAVFAITMAILWVLIETTPYVQQYLGGMSKNIKIVLTAVPALMAISMSNYVGWFLIIFGGSLLLLIIGGFILLFGAAFYIFKKTGDGIISSSEGAANLASKTRKAWNRAQKRSDKRKKVNASEAEKKEWEEKGELPHRARAKFNRAIRHIKGLNLPKNPYQLGDVLDFLREVVKNIPSGELKDYLRNPKFESVHQGNTKDGRIVLDHAIYHLKLLDRYLGDNATNKTLEQKELNDYWAKLETSDLWNTLSDGRKKEFEKKRDEILGIIHPKLIGELRRLTRKILLEITQIKNGEDAQKGIDDIMQYVYAETKRIEDDYLSIAKHMEEFRVLQASLEQRFKEYAKAGDQISAATKKIKAVRITKTPNMKTVGKSVRDVANALTDALEHIKSKEGVVLKQEQELIKTTRNKLEAIAQTYTPDKGEEREAIRKQKDEWVATGGKFENIKDKVEEAVNKILAQEKKEREMVLDYIGGIENALSQLSNNPEALKNALEQASSELTKLSSTTEDLLKDIEKTLEAEKKKKEKESESEEAYALISEMASQLNGRMYVVSEGEGTKPTRCKAQSQEELLVMSYAKADAAVDATGDSIAGIIKEEISFRNFLAKGKNISKRLESLKNSIPAEKANTSELDIWVSTVKSLR